MEKVGISPVFTIFSVADSDGVRRICSNAPTNPNYFIFMGNFENNWEIDQIETQIANLNPLSKIPRPAPAFIHKQKRSPLNFPHHSEETCTGVNHFYYTIDRDILH